MHLRTTPLLLRLISAAKKIKQGDRQFSHFLVAAQLCHAVGLQVVWGLPSAYNAIAIIALIIIIIILTAADLNQTRRITGTFTVTSTTVVTFHCEQ